MASMKVFIVATLCCIFALTEGRSLRKKRQIGGNNVLGRITLTCTGGTTPICMCNTLLPQLCAKDSVPQYSSGWCVCCSTTGSSPYYPTTYGSSLSTGVGSYQSGFSSCYPSCGSSYGAMPYGSASSSGYGSTYPQYNSYGSAYGSAYPYTGAYGSSNMLGAYGGYGMSPYNSYGGGSAYGSVSPYGYNQPYYGGSASSSYGGYPSTGYYGGNSYGYGTYGSSYPYYGGVVG